MKPTQEQVIAWAQESGALIAPFISLNDTTFSPASLQDFAALAYEAGRKDENEACAVIAFNAKTYIKAAAAIRARGQS